MNPKKPDRKKSPSSERGRKGPGKSGPAFKKPHRPKGSEGGADRPFRSKEGDGDRKPRREREEGRSSDRGPSKKPFRSGEERGPRPFGNSRDSERSGGRRQGRSEGNSKRPFREEGERRPYSSEGNRKPYSSRGEREGGRSSSDGNRKPYSRRDESSSEGNRRPYSRRDESSSDGNRKPYSRRGESSSEGNRKPYSSRGEREGGRSSSDANRKPYSRRDESSSEGNRRPYSRRDEGNSSYEGGRKPFSEREGGRSSFEGNRRPYSPRSDREGKKPFGDRKERGDRKPFSSSDFQRGEGGFRKEKDSFSRGEGRGPRGGRGSFSKDKDSDFQKPFHSRSQNEGRRGGLRSGFDEDSHHEGIRAGWQSAKLSLSEFDRPEVLTYHASCGDGLAFLLKEEVEDAGLELVSENRGGVFFRGPAKKVRDFCLSSGISSGISFELSSWNDIQGPDDLYEVAAMYPFEKLLSPGMKFRIDATTKDNLPDSRYATYRLKDAIFDRFRAKGLELPEADREEPEILFYIRSRMDQVKLFLALHPQPLQRRGHEREGGEAPLRETLAQALLRFSGWKPGESLYDPFCGSGTLLIEAALRMRNGGWINYKSLSRSTIFTRLFGPCKAKDIESKEGILLFGSDVSEEAVDLAKKNAKEAGVADLIRFGTFPAENPPEDFAFTSGKIVTNPPYGIRIGDRESVSELYSAWGETLKSKFSGTYVSLVAGDPSLLGYLKLKSDKEQSVTIAKLKGKLVAYRID
nr:N-6 DNA methylase [Leptospira wolffii]